MGKVHDERDSLGVKNDLKDTSSPSGCLCCAGCARWFRRLLPIGCLTEVRELVKLALPLLLSQLLYSLQNITGPIFCGHLGKKELDAVSLANSVLIAAGYCIAYGFTAATDTLISQTYGGKNLKRIGLILQKAIIMLLLICMPCWALFLNTENLLLLFKQDPQVSRMSAEYIDVSIPTLLWVFLYQLQASFLKNQGITVPLVVIGVVSNVINAILNYVFLFVLYLGVWGAALALNIAWLSEVIMVLLYIWIKKLHIGVWGGWSWDCLQQWGSLTSLAIPSILALGFEWWIYEIGTMLTGLLSVTELAAQAILYQIITIAYTIPYSMGVAASVRVGNYLGAGDAELAKTSSTVSLISIGVICVVDVIVILGLRTVIAKIFTNDEEINELVSCTLLVYSLCHVFESLSCTAFGVLRGIGKQKMCAIVYGISCYVVGLPVVVVLMFVAKLGMIGLWTGLTICLLIPSIIFITYIARVDWKKMKEEAQERAGLKQNTAGLIHPYTNHLSEEVKWKNVFIFSDKLQSNGSPHHLPIRDICTSTDVAKDKGLLPVKTLILRRGLVVTAAVLILVAGVLLRVLL